MQTNLNNESQNGYVSVYRRGAHDGALFGAYLSVMFIASAMSMKFPLVGLAGTVMALAVPCLIYVFLRKSMRMDRGRSTFSALWMHGIVTFICGSAIMALVMYVFMKYVRPNFIITQLYALIDAYDSMHSPAADQLSSMLQQIIDQKMVPTPISVAATTLWFASFSGSLLSMIVALIVRYVIPKKERKQQPPLMK